MGINGASAAHDEVKMSLLSAGVQYCRSRCIVYFLTRCSAVKSRYMNFMILWYLFLHAHFRTEDVESVDFVSVHIYLNVRAAEKSWGAKLMGPVGVNEKYSI